MDLLGGPDKRAAVIKDSLQVLDDEVGDKGGIGGIAIKAAYKVVKGISPDFLQKVVDGLLNDFLHALDPLYQSAIGAGKAAQTALTGNPSAVADALLSITDTRAQRVKNPVVGKAYGKLRGSAKKHVEAAVPRLATLLGKHLPN